MGYASIGNSITCAARHTVGKLDAFERVASLPLWAAIAAVEEWTLSQ